MATTTFDESDDYALSDLSVGAGGWDRPLLDAASMCAEPICWAVEKVCFRVRAPLGSTKFDNCESEVAEVAYRAFILLTAAFAAATLIIPVTFVALGIASKVLRAVAFALQQNGSTHVRGNLPEQSVDHAVKTMTINVCGIAGGLGYNHGGVIPWPKRLDRIVDKIVDENKANPDVLVLQEIYDTALAEALIERLKDHFAHFYIHLGANTIGSVGGLMVMTKCAVHSFTNTSFSNNEWDLNRTFATLEIKARPQDTVPCARIIGTHLIHDDNDKRIVQLGEIVASLQQAAPIPTVLMGDLNLERKLPAEGGMLESHFEHGYKGEAMTCTNAMLRQWDESLPPKSEWIDYIDRYRAFGGKLENVELVPMFNPETSDTQEALSDHNGLVGRFSW